jgi:hypothetical protein
MKNSDDLEAKPQVAAGVAWAEARSGARCRSGRPLTAGMAVLVILCSIGSLCEASACDGRASTASAWLQATGVTLLMLGGLYAVGAMEGKGTIRVTRWLRAAIIGWLVVGAPVAVGIQTYFRYSPSPLLGGPATLLALIAMPLGIAGTVVISHGQSRWLRILLSVLYLGLASVLSLFVGLVVAGLHGDAL